MCSDIYFTKKMYPNILNTVPARPMVHSKVENLQFYFGGVICVTGLSGAFEGSQVFLGILTLGMNKLH